MSRLFRRDGNDRGYQTPPAQGGLFDRRSSPAEPDPRTSYRAPAYQIPRREPPRQMGGGVFRVTKVRQQLRGLLND